jgi:hypothetical protein
MLQEDQKFVFADGLNVSGLTPQVVEKIFGPMLECGRCHRQLEEFIVSTKSENRFIVQVSNSELINLTQFRVTLNFE